MADRPTQLDPRASRILRGRRRRRAGLASAALLIVAGVVASWAFRAGGLSTDRGRLHQKWCRVVGVVAGDTLRVEPDDGAAVVVKLIGVDANGDAPALAFTESAVSPRVLLYLQDVPTRDHAGNVLAYAYLEDGSLLNQAILDRGLAYADRRWDYAYRASFTQAEEAASRKRVGVWADDGHEATMPEWRRRWLGEMRKEVWAREPWVRSGEP